MDSLRLEIDYRQNEPADIFNRVAEVTQLMRQQGNKADEIDSRLAEARVMVEARRVAVVKAELRRLTELPLEKALAEFTKGGGAVSYELPDAGEEPSMDLHAYTRCDGRREGLLRQARPGDVLANQGTDD